MNPDITDKEKLNLFDCIFENVYQVFLRVDLLTGDGVTLAARDDAWRVSTGMRFDFEKIIYTYILDVSADADPMKTLNELKLENVTAKLQEKRFYEVYNTVHGKEGRLSVCAFTFFRGEGDTIYMGIRDATGGFHDVSGHIQKLEKALQKADKESDEKNTFLTLLSRNVRTPLYSIMGLTRAAESDLGSNTAFDDYLHKVSMSGTYMNETINDVLDLRRISRNEIVLNEEEIYLKPFFEEIERMIAPSMYEKGLIFRMNTDSVSDLTIMADHHCLQQIQLKLLQSAINYTIQGGRIDLDVRELFRTQEMVTLEFSVRDRGIVIDQERLKVLFQPYDYLKSKIDSHIGSLDIDLIILKSYVHAMGTDTLTAESDASRGTRISITLTVPLAEEQYEERSDSQEMDFSGKRVLVVDDNEINLEIVRKILYSRNIEVVSAKNGHEAVDLFQRENGRFDLILMDILMPVMDGLEATRRIRAMRDIPGAGQVPIVAMTANAFRENFEESFNAGMDAHLVKPIEPERLIMVMSDVMSRKNHI